MSQVVSEAAGHDQAWLCLGLEPNALRSERVAMSVSERVDPAALVQDASSFLRVFEVMVFRQLLDSIVFFQRQTRVGALPHKDAS